MKKYISKKKKKKKKNQTPYASQRQKDLDLKAACFDQ